MKKSKLTDMKTLFLGKPLKAQGIIVNHIDNAVIHRGLETIRRF